MNNHHQNARTTFFSRVLIVQRVLKEGKSVREVAEALGVSRRTIYRWLARYRAGGQDALSDKSSRPLHSPRRLPVGRVATITAMRRMHMSSPQIAFCLSMPLSSVTHELRRLGFNHFPLLEPWLPGGLNPMRLLLASLAYILWETLRRMGLKGTELALAQAETIRLRLLKLGAVDIRNTRRVRLMLTSSYPFQTLFCLVAARPIAPKKHMQIPNPEKITPRP